MRLIYTHISSNEYLLILEIVADRFSLSIYVVIMSSFQQLHTTNQKEKNKKNIDKKKNKINN